ncbi:hypothetical protein QJQ45_010216 [Haematococcus lacustris]|nr:hypothetical protein QJQ45_010216 [Haematococcus lacustris]
MDEVATVLLKVQVIPASQLRSRGGKLITSAMDLKGTLEREYEAYKKIQQDLSKAVTARTQLVSQATENEGVMEELKVLGEDANVYKLVGPALVKQDLIEAKSNVSKRISYIKAELDRVDGQIKAFEGKSKEKEQEAPCSSQGATQPAASELSTPLPAKRSSTPLPAKRTKVEGKGKAPKA